MTQRRQRIDSADAAVAIMTGALSDVLPPDHNKLPPEAMPFWHEIARGRTRDEWESAPALLSTAVSLAWTQWQISQFRGMFDGSIKMPNELKAAMLSTRMLDMQRLEMAYLRVLQQHGVAKGGDQRDVDKRRQQAKIIVADNPLDNRLIARPN